MNHAVRNQTSSDTSESGNCETIAHQVCDLLAKIHAEHPNWIKQRYQNISFTRQREQLYPKVLALLETSVDGRSISLKITGFLEKILDPKIFSTEAAQRLIRSLLSPSLPINGQYSLEPAQLLLPAAVEVSSQAAIASSPDPESISILLLDVENLDLSNDAELWLAQFCQYPISLKFAFGDWKKLGKRDEVLHRRGYHLIHVPQGKNHADSKMTVVGSSILVHLPTIKEAIVCSNDSDLEDLRSILRFQGLKVSWLQRHKAELKLTHCHTREVHVFKPPKPAQIPSKAAGLEFLSQYFSGDVDKLVPFNQICLEFSREFGFPLTTFTKYYKLGKTPKAFFSNSSNFRVTHDQATSMLYVGLARETSASETASTKTTSSSSKGFSANSLKVVSVGIIRHLIKEQSVETIPVSTVAAAFHQQYGQSMKSMFKNLGINQSVPTFLGTCKNIQVEQIQKQWIVRLSK